VQIDPNILNDHTGSISWVKQSKNNSSYSSKHQELLYLHHITSHSKRPQSSTTNEINSYYSPGMVQFVVMHKILTCP